MPPFVPPDSGNLPEAGKHILKAVYVSLRKKNVSQESAAKQAWAAVKNAGWRKKGDSWIKDSEAVRNCFLAFKMSENVKLSEARGIWNKMSEQQHLDYFDVDNVWETHDEAAEKMNEYFDLFDKMREAHPELDVDKIWELVTEEVDKKQHPMNPTTGPPVAADSGSPLQRYWPPSEISPQQTGNGRIYTAPGANLKLGKLHESFRWLAPFKITKDASTRRIQGEAITVGKSRNKVPYTEDELMRAGRTLAGKPLLHNHIESVAEAQAYLKGMRSDGSTFDPNLIPLLVRANIEAMISRGDVKNGTILDSEFEDGAVEYDARIETPEAIAMADAGLIKGPSIGAVPRNQSLTNPKGITFEDMSLITAPETPGDPDATAKVMEKLREMLQPESVPIASVATLNDRLQITLELRSRITAEMRSRVSDSLTTWRP